MSAYGTINRPETEGSLSAKIWPVKSSNAGYLTTHHITSSIASQLPDLLAYLALVFAQEVEDGLTYPQEGEMCPETFNAYFFAADVIVGIIGGQESEDIPLDVDAARAGRTWDECVAGYYYVKPNYPGRSSHICNAGFVVPPKHRGRGYGSTLAKSYLDYAPRLGYQASVFNLVYVNNLVSIKTWERLNFTKVGLIPRAGRLKRTDGQGEEYIDAWIFYKTFLND